MGDTTKRYRIYLYKQRKGYQLIEELNVRNTYDQKIWHKPMPTIGEHKCRKILNKISPELKVNEITVLIENVETGDKHIQTINRSGTIITG